MGCGRFTENLVRAKRLGRSRKRKGRGDTNRVYKEQERRIEEEKRQEG